MVLIAFGRVGVFDAAGSAALVVHFATHFDTFRSLKCMSASRERVVVSGRLIVCVATTIASGLRVAERAHANESVGGIVVSAASIAGLGVPAARKRRLAHRVPSRALLADSWLSLVGCLTEICAVVGTTLDAAFG